MIDHEDLDGVSAEALVTAEVGGVVNAARSISGRYPNLGPIRLLEAGIPLVDTVGPLLLRKVREGDELRLDGDRIYAGDRLVGVGIRQSTATIRESMEEAQLRLADRFESFARNTVDYMQRERDLLFGGSGLPPLDHELANRPVLVVVRGYNYKEDLAVLRPYIRDVRPVLLGVDGGADALIEAGYTPDLILGDMDSVSDEALSFARPARRRWFRRSRPTELVLHAYRDGHAPGRERLEALGVPFRVVEAAGTSEDVAFLLAHEKGAETIVAVGSHGNLREFLDKGREGMSSTFLVRLRVGEILMDAKGVSRVYSPRIRTRDAFLLVAAALVAIAAVVVVSPPLRLYVSQLVEQFRQWLFDLKELAVISFRYHIVTIVAIFLALAIGLLGGSGVRAARAAGTAPGSDRSPPQRSRGSHPADRRPPRPARRAERLRGRGHAVPDERDAERNAGRPRHPGRRGGRGAHPGAGGLGERRRAHPDDRVGHRPARLGGPDHRRSSWRRSWGSRPRRRRSCPRLAAEALAQGLSPSTTVIGGEVLGDLLSAGFLAPIGPGPSQATLEEIGAPGQVVVVLSGGRGEEPTLPPRRSRSRSSNGWPGWASPWRRGSRC